MKRRFLTAEYIRLRKKEGCTRLQLEPGDTLTSLARDVARDAGVEIIAVPKTPTSASEVASSTPVAAPTSAVLAAPAPQVAALVHNGSNGNGQGLEALVRQVVMACLAATASQAAPAETPVKHIAAASIRLAPFPFEINRPEMDVQLVDVITAEHGSPIAAGFLSFHKGSFPWTLTYDEVEFVLEGEIHIGTAEGTVVGKPGDVLYIPKGTSITFGTPSWAKILYVTYPAEWSG